MGRSGAILREPESALPHHLGHGGASVLVLIWKAISGSRHFY